MLKFSASGLLRPALMLTASATLLASCASVGGSVTEATICAELRADLPSWSSQDTPQSVAEGARFVATFEALCP